MISRNIVWLQDFSHLHFRWEPSKPSLFLNVTYIRRQLHFTSSLIMSEKPVRKELRDEIPHSALRALWIGKPTGSTTSVPPQIHDFSPTYIMGILSIVLCLMLTRPKHVEMVWSP